MGDKVSAKQAMIKAGVPCVPGSDGALPDDPKEIVRIARKIGYPVIIKAAGGGGGRGMRVVHTEAALLNAVNMTRAEAQAAFGNAVVYLEKFLEQPRHIEIQVLADSPQERRLPRRARLLAAAPPPEGHRGGAGAATCRASCATRSASAASTPAADRLPRRRHLRVPVRGRRVLLHRDEHPRAGRAPGDRDDHRHRHRAGADPRRRRREAALAAEATSCCAATRSSAASTPRTRTASRPRPGRITSYHPPGGPGIRVDSHVYQGYTVPPNYDSMIGKVIAYGATPRAGDRAHAHRAVGDGGRRASRPTSRCTASCSTTRASCAAACRSTTSSRSSRRSRRRRSDALARAHAAGRRRGGRGVQRRAARGGRAVGLARGRSRNARRSPRCLAACDSRIARSSLARRRARRRASRRAARSTRDGAGRRRRLGAREPGAVRAARGRRAPVDRPSWHRPPRRRIAVRIDPGLAFGTGSHPSTRSCSSSSSRKSGAASAFSTTAAAPVYWRSPPRSSAQAHVDAVDVDPEAVETRVPMRAPTASR